MAGILIDDDMAAEIVLKVLLIRLFDGTSSGDEMTLSEGTVSWL